MTEATIYAAEAAEKAVWKAVWAYICDASSMNVVLSGPEYKAAMRDYRAAIEANERARIAEAVEGLREDDASHGWNAALANVLRLIEGEPKDAAHVWVGDHGMADGGNVR